MEMPDEYIGREQTWLKHRVLKLYLEPWAHKIGSFATRLWYVDCFAGPWESPDTTRGDTSIAIGLGALNDAARTWSGKADIKLDAVFVEKRPKAYASLEVFSRAIAGAVEVHTFAGQFGDHVDEIDRLIGNDHAFVFVDPTGWDGAAMQFIAKLASGRRRDVLINVMYDHINRFKDDKRAFLRDQMRQFFGLTDSDLQAGLTEDGLMRLYRRRLGEVAKLDYVADLAIPVPTRNRTNFRLVVGGHNREVVRLFRDVEKRVIGKEAAGVRDAAKKRATEERTKQPLLLGAAAPPADALYVDQRAVAEQEVREALPKRLRETGPMTFGELWPRVLCACHITYTDLKALVWAMGKEGSVVVEGVKSGQRSLQDAHVLRLP